MHQQLLTLLKAGLWGKRSEELEGFPLSAERWKEVFELARRQTVTGIVYQGITMLPEEMMPPQPLLIRWVAEVDRIEANNQQMERALKELLSMYRVHDIHPIVMKGQGTAAMYDISTLRECGDIDLYFINDKESERARNLLHTKGITYEVHADRSMCYTWMGIEVEHHTELVDLHRPKNRMYAAQLINEQGYIPMTTAGGTEIEVASPLINMLMQSTHILKHALGKGIGLRQLCDMARTYHYLQGKINQTTLHEIYAAVGLQRWNELLHAFLTQHLGLPHQLQPYKSLQQVDTTPLLRIIEKGGNFGQHRTQATEKNSRIRTALCIWEQRRFSWKYARKEAVWMVFRLVVKG